MFQAEGTALHRNHRPGERVAESETGEHSRTTEKMEVCSGEATQREQGQTMPPTRAEGPANQVKKFHHNLKCPPSPRDGCLQNPMWCFSNATSPKMRLPILSAKYVVPSSVFQGSLITCVLSPFSHSALRGGYVYTAHALLPCALRHGRGMSLFTSVFHTYTVSDQ